jgi:2-polyprenyl-3-methyl-5-hydroxy-6-metoxy-1,4-benzoquinol methylase
LFTNPRPEAEQAGYFYKSENYISHSNTQKGFINKLYHAVRNITLKQKTNLIQGDQQGTKNLLDIGCGNGHFLHACQQRGWNTFGMELDPDTAERAASLTGQSIFPNLQAIPDEPQFELISLWHVLEHVYEIDAYFEFFKKRITPSGKLLLALPNSKSFDAHYFKEYWAAYDVPRHIYHFNPETIQSVAKKHGFKLKKQRGQIFDSFYIALLSHEYKTGSKKLVASFLIGLWSNILAYFKTGNYSSNIYIFEHA